jgi:hypothetical protein
MPTVDPTSLAEQARTLAADLRATYNAGEVKAQRAAALLDTIADALAPSPASTSEPRPLKVGDHVRIARKTLTRDAGGFVVWVTYMDYTIGQTGVIDRIDSEGLPHVSFNDDPEGWWYPTEALDFLPAEDGQ